MQSKPVQFVSTPLHAQNQ